MLLSSIYLSGCHSVKPTHAAVSSEETVNHTLSPNSANNDQEKSPKSKTPQVPQVPNPEQTETKQKTEPVLGPKTTPDPAQETAQDPILLDESDNNPAPTPPPDPPSTPIHPFYELAGAPPSAPGLAMRVRKFNEEPEKIAYLTFDDGPYPETTPRILKILKDEGVKATFFVIGKQVERYPDLLKAEYEQGEGIGNHSYSHDYRLLYRSPEAFLADIKQAEAVIYNTIGIRTQIIRVPGGTQGNFHINYYNAVDSADYMVYDWNVSCGDADASQVPIDKLISNIKIQVPNKTRIIVLMHDTGAKLTTVEALSQIIEYLKQQGFSFGVLTPNVAPILFPGGFHS